jgi:Fe-S cluster biogenesis protein NfuA
MSPLMNNSEFQAQTEQIERLVQRVMALTDDGARATALELLQSVMDLHGAAMSRMVEVLSDSGEAGRAALAKLSADPLLCGLLVLYGVHPVPFEERVAKALEKLRPQLQKKGASVELITTDEARVRVSIQSSGHGCGSSTDGIKDMVEQAILEAAPDVIEILVEGLPETAPGFVPVNMIQPATTRENAKEDKRYEESAA